MNIIKVMSEVYLVLGVSGIILYSTVPRFVEGGDGSGSSEGIMYLVGQSMLIGGLISVSNEINWEGYGVGLVIDSMGNMVKGAMYIMSGVCVITSYSVKGSGIREYSIILMMSSIGLGLMVSGKDLMSVYLGVELQALSLYVLASYKRESSYGTEGGLKYFVIGGFGSGVLLMGSGLIYGEVGSIRLEEIGRVLMCVGEEGISEELRVGILCIIVGLVFKLGGVPFHMWVADVYEGTIMSGVKYFSVVPKIGIMCVLIRVLREVPVVVWEKWIVMIAIGSLLISTLGALYQRRVKRFIGWSGIGHVGFMLMGVVGGDIKSVYVYMIVYMVTTWGLMEVIEREKIKYIEEVGKLRGGVMGAVVCILMFSMAGVPPMAGFFTKLYVLKSGLEGGYYILAIVGVLTSVVSGYYYLRWIKVMYFERSGWEGRVEKRESSLPSAGDDLKMWHSARHRADFHNQRKRIGEKIGSVMIGVAVLMVSSGWVGVPLLEGIAY